MEERPILICYDGSENASRAIAAAADLLSPRYTVVLDVTPPLTAEEQEAALFSPVIADNLDDRVRDARKVARKGVRQARQLGLEAVERVDISVATWEGVVEVADEIDAAVIVVGSRGLSGAREFLDGSLSHELARHARRPVLIVPPSRAGR